jgi:hypothetical protein
MIRSRNFRNPVFEGWSLRYERRPITCLSKAMRVDVSHSANKLFYRLGTGNSK